MPEMSCFGVIRVSDDEAQFDAFDVLAMEGEDLRPLAKVIAAMRQLGATHVTINTRLDMASGCIRNRLRFKREMGTARPRCLLRKS
jgi:hypothetical protein